MIYTLSPDDLDLADDLARQRNGSKEAAGIRSHKVANRSDQSIHYLGLLAEIAVARTLGVEIDRNIYLTGDSGYDLRWSGQSIDVKMRGNRDKDLPIMPGMRDFTADFAVLCWPAGYDVVEIVGCVSRWRFRQECRADLVPNRLVMLWQQLTLL